MAFQATNIRIHFQPVVFNFLPNKASGSTLGMRDLLGQRFHARELEKLGQNYLHLFALSCCRNFFLSFVMFATLIFEIHLESDLGFKHSKVRHVDAYELLERNFATEIFKIQSPARCFEPELKLSVTNYQGCRQVSAWSRRIMLRLVILTLALLLYDDDDDDDPLAVSWHITSQLFG